MTCHEGGQKQGGQSALLVRGFIEQAVLQASPVSGPTTEVRTKERELSSLPPTISQDETPIVEMGSQPAFGESALDSLPSDDARGVQVNRLSLASTRASTRASYRRRRGGGGSDGGGRKDPSRKMGLYSDAELEELEAQYADGLTAVQAVELFVSRGVRLSEASFRKYVQQGLVPRSRRVGRKGKHRGSMGVYPTKTVRRLNEIKRLMGEGYTIEEIQAQFLRFTSVLETLQEGFIELFQRLDEELDDPRFDKQTRRAIERDTRDARKSATALMDRIERISQRVSRRRGDEYRDPGAAGGAEDLL